MNNTIEVLELYLKMSDGYFRADVKTAIKQVIATIKALKRERVDVEGNCYYCNKLVNNLAGNPSEWGIPLCHSDEPGKVKPHHIGCVSDRLEVLESAGDELPEKKEIPDGATDGRVRYGTSQFNYCLDLCQIVLAKQILKVEILKVANNEKYWRARYKKLKEQQLTEEEIVKVMSGAFDDSITWRHIPFADDFPYEDVMTKLNKELAKAIIKAREEKIKPPEPPKGRLIKDGKIEKGR